MFFGIRDPGSEIRDPGWEKTRIRDKHPGSATLVSNKVLYSKLCVRSFQANT
jgi:hypothetical protein